MKVILLAQKQCEHQELLSGGGQITLQLWLILGGMGSLFSVSVHGSLGNSQLVQLEEYKNSGSSHTWKKKHLGRQTELSFQTSFSGMVTESDGVQHDFGRGGLSKCRSVCNPPEQQTASLWSPVLDNRALAIDALSVNWDGIDICLFPIYIDSSDNQQSSPTPMQNSVDRPILARNVLVS
ncbi:MAG: hypothetical protein ABW098_02075 [Candidatus Thiodiazotropha sp.]